MGIIGAVLMLPAMLCSACAAGVAAAAGDGSDGTAIFFLVGILPIPLGIIGGILGKSGQLVSMLLLLAAAVLALIGWILAGFTSFFHLAAFVLFLIGGIIAKTQKTE
jgi:hypothetical protein